MCVCVFVCIYFLQDLEETIVSVREEHQQFEESTMETIEQNKQQQYTIDKKETVGVFSIIFLVWSLL